MHQPSKYILAIAALAGLAGCSKSDSDEPAQPASRVITIDFGDSGIDIWQPARSAVRALDEAPAPDELQSVGIFAINNVDQGLVFDNRQFFNKNSATVAADATLANLATEWPATNDWIYTPQTMWTSGADYAFVGYSPYSATGVSVVTGEDGDIAEMVWEGLSSISDTDHMIATRVDYRALSADNPALPMTMKHLMARLRFCFKLSADFADLRTVVVKEMKVDYADSRLMTLAVSYVKEGSEYRPVYRWQRGEAGTGTSSLTLRNEGGVESITLAKGVDYQALASLYYEPGDPLTMFNIDVTYDVYDSAGQLLRANDRAVSAVSVLRTVAAGYCYNVKILIKPSYLYVLSDQEPDTDGSLNIP